MELEDVYPIIIMVIIGGIHWVGTEPTATHTIPIIHIPTLITMAMVLDGEILIVGAASIVDGEVGMDGVLLDLGEIVETEDMVVVKS